MNQNISWGKIAVLMVAIIGVGALGFVVGKKDGEPIAPAMQVTPPKQIPPQSQEVSVVDKKIYFGEGSDGKYRLVDVQTGGVTDFIPSGYRIVNQWNIPIFPAFLILQKENDLYLYNTENKTTHSIDLRLGKNEQVQVSASITEKDKFFIRIDELDRIQISEFDGSSPVISSRTYSLDASINRVVGVTNVEFDGCAEYDSLNQRFFTWPCGEGIGSSAPLSIFNLSGKIQRDLVTVRDFGTSQENSMIRVKSQNGLFFALNDDEKDFRVIVIDPMLMDPIKEVYIADDYVKSQLIDLSVYSVSIDRNNHTLVIGGGDDILLLRFDANKQIVQSAYIPDKEIYANFIFVNDGKLYYKMREGIRVVDLDKWRIEKTISSASSDFSEITLFAL